MSLHINMTEEAESRIRNQRRNNFFLAVLTACLAISLLGIGLYLCIIVIPSIEKPEVAAYAMDDTMEAPSDRPVTPERAHSRPSAPSNQPVSVIQTTAPTEMAVVSVDVDMPDASIAQSDGDFGTDLGHDPGDGGKGFGDGNKGGSALEGTFYDFKLKADGTASGISMGGVTKLLQEFVQKRWSQRILDDYFKAPKKLYASQVYIPTTPADKAPQAFGLSNPGRLWCIIYRGKVVAPKSGTFRFVGAGDNFLTVRFNNEHVFDFGIEQIIVNRRNDLKGKGGEWFQVMTGKAKNNELKKSLEAGGVNKLPMTFYEYTGDSYWPRYLGGLAVGKAFTVKAGETYPIEILTGELPGSRFASILLIEEVGAKPYRVDSKTGAPILNIFRTNYAVPDAKQMKGYDKEIVPFDPIGPIWQAVKG